MSYSDFVATMSFVIACAAFGFPYWRDRQVKKREKRKEFLEQFTKTNWTNEGDISATPKAYYMLEMYKAGGLSNVYGALHVNNVKYYEFYGDIDANGILRTTLRMPLGKFGANIAKVKLIYSEDVGQVTYVFDGFIDNKEMAHENNLLDTKQQLWRIENSI
jgi:hypothetical protein